MRRKYLGGILAAMLACTTLAGCSQTAQNASGGETLGTEETTETETTQDDGKVTLTVWAEQASFPLLQEMIDSFEQKYAGQADFDIQLVESADAETRNNLLADVHNGADVFPLPDD